MGALGFKTVLSPKTPAATAHTNPKPASHFRVDLLPALLVVWLAKSGFPHSAHMNSVDSSTSTTAIELAMSQLPMLRQRPVTFLFMMLPPE
jgi:hypothetical protein